MISENLSVNEAGHLTLAGQDMVTLAQEYGTPLYLMDENRIRENMRLFRSLMNRHYENGARVCYASKAFSCKQIYRIAREEGIGIDTVSAGELYTALKAGFDPGRIYYHGSNKTPSELSYILEQNVGRIVVDSFQELELLDRIAGELKKKASILLRLSPGVDSHTHDFIKTGVVDSKFGFPIQLGMATQAVQLAMSKKNLLLKGIHCHIGSQILDIEPFEETAEVMLRFMSDCRSLYPMEELNLGGGFGVQYRGEDAAVSYDAFLRRVSDRVKAVCAHLKMPVPTMVIEPGRSIVASAGVTLYTVGNIRELPGIRTYVSIDGGMTDNIRYALYQSDYEFVIANRAGEAKTQMVAVAGRCCESGDLLAMDVPIQACQSGDILAVLATGAYNYAMSSNYNRTLKPPVVMLKDGTSYVAVKRETLADLIRNDV